MNSKKIHEILIKVSSLVAERKLKQTFTYEIFSVLKNFDFSENKLAILKKNIKKTADEVKDVERNLIKVNINLSVLKKDKAALEEKYLLFKKIERDLEKKKNILPVIMSEIDSYKKENSKLQSELKKLQIKQNMELCKIDELKLKNSSLAQKIDQILIEIPITKSTKELILGIMPEGYDNNTYNIMKGDFETNIKNYFSEIDMEIETIKAESLKIKSEIDKEIKKENLIFSEKPMLEGKFKKLLNEIGNQNVDKEVIILNINKLKEQKKNFVEELTQNKNRINQIESEIKDIDVTLEKEHNNNNRLRSRYDYLFSIKQKLDKVKNFEVEMQRLEKEEENLSFNTIVNKKLIEIISQINKENMEVLYGK
ncbi:MAG: hypothetical protein HQK79_11350 [Desulfobacterales bacterium]|nr:hypothetical protein [Desulfobacterales bacterium]